MGADGIAARTNPGAHISRPTSLGPQALPDARAGLPL